MDAILTWIETHPGLSSWVQAIGSVVALGFAVILPALSRRADRKHAEECRKSIFIVLLTDAENIILRRDSDADSVDVTKAALDDVIQRMRSFLDVESHLSIARLGLQIKGDLESLRRSLEGDWSVVQWAARKRKALKNIYEATINLVESSPKILPSPLTKKK